MSDATTTAARKAFGYIGPAPADYTDKVLFGEVWERLPQPPRDRLVTGASVIALYHIDEPFHLKKSLENGISRDELVEMFTHLAFYSGWPTANMALPIAQGVFKEMGG